MKVILEIWSESRVGFAVPDVNLHLRNEKTIS